MELKDYVKIIGLRFWLFVLVVIVTMLGAYFFTVSQPEAFDGSAVIYVNKKSDQPEAGDFEYDKYYAIQASSLMANTIVNWLADPSNVIKIYDNANLDLPTEKLNKLAKVINVKKSDPAAIKVTASSTNESNVYNLISSTKDFTEKRLNSDIVNGSAENFYLTFSDITVLRRQKSVVMNTFIGLISGIVLGLALVFLVEYFNPKYKK